MNAKFSNIGLAIWIFAVVVSSGLAESFSGRPTETNMDDLMALGIKTGHGVYERCYATQYQTNPVTYYVSPPSFIGTNGWYLSTSMMQDLDSKAKSLVSYYVNTNTVYDGTTNIVMLSVTGLWAQLEIGDHTNQFTGTPAIGTNLPTYGDYPWRIYSESLEERYDVLNALKMSRAYGTKLVLAQDGSFMGTTSSWNAAKSIAESIYSVNKSTSCVSLSDAGLSCYSVGDQLSLTFNATLSSDTILTFPSLACTNVSYLEAKSFVFSQNTGMAPPGRNYYDDNGLGVQSNVWNLIEYPFGLAEGSIPVWVDPVIESEDGKTRGFIYSHRVYVTWDFQYCTEE